MITIGKPSVKTKDGHSRLEAEISIDDKTSVLWIEVAEEYGRFLCHERSDAFVLGLLHYAMKYGHDITCEAAMTERLYEQLTEQFLPAFFKINRFADWSSGCKGPGHGVKITAPLASEVPHPQGGNAIGTGVSCGVDSLHVFACHPEITHGCVWQVHGVTSEETEDKRNAGWGHLVTRSQSFVKERGIKLIIANSNFDRGAFENLQFDGSISYGNLFFILGLQKLWSRYYVASGYDVAEFRLDCGVNGDPAHYEWVLFQACSLDNIAILMDGVAQSRVEKIKDLANYEPAKKFLNVCHEITEDGSNCNHYCAKCMRTMLELDACNALESFSEVFDVEYYKSHFHEYLAELYRGYLQGNFFALELKPYFCNRHYPLKTKIAAWRIVLSKAIKKILRGGATQRGKFSSRG